MKVQGNAADHNERSKQMNRLTIPTIFRKEATTLDSFFNDLFFSGWPSHQGQSSPKVCNNNDSITLTFEVPGFEKSEIQVECDDQQLWVHATSSDESRQPIHYRASIPTINLKTSSASLKNGILTITLQKSDLAKKHEIKIS